MNVDAAGAEGEIPTSATAAVLGQVVDSVGAVALALPFAADSWCILDLGESTCRFGGAKPLTTAATARALRHTSDLRNQGDRQGRAKAWYSTVGCNIDDTVYANNRVQMHGTATTTTVTESDLNP